MIAADCTCSSGSFFWHESGCASLRRPEHCYECGCTGYHAIGCPATPSSEPAREDGNGYRA